MSGFFNLFGARFTVKGDEGLIRNNLKVARTQLKQLDLVNVQNLPIVNNRSTQEDGTFISCSKNQGIYNVQMVAPPPPKEIIIEQVPEVIPVGKQDYTYIPMILLFDGIGPVYPNDDINKFPDRLGWAMYRNGSIEESPIFWPYDEDSEGGINVIALGEALTQERGGTGNYICERLGPIDYRTDDYDNDWEDTFFAAMNELGLPLAPGYPDYLDFYFDVQFKISDSDILHFMSAIYARDDGVGSWDVTDCYAILDNRGIVTSFKTNPTTAEQDPYHNPILTGGVEWFPDAWPKIFVGNQQYNIKAHAGFDDDNNDGLTNVFPVGREVVRYIQLN